MTKIYVVACVFEVTSNSTQAATHTIYLLHHTHTPGYPRRKDEQAKKQEA